MIHVTGKKGIKQTPQMTLPFQGAISSRKAEIKPHNRVPRERMERVGYRSFRHRSDEQWEGHPVYAPLDDKTLWDYVSGIPRKHFYIRRELMWYINPANGWTKRGEPANFRYWKRIDQRKWREWRKIWYIVCDLGLKPGEPKTIGKLTVKYNRVNYITEELVFYWNVPKEQDVKKAMVIQFPKAKSLR